MVENTAIPKYRELWTIQLSTRKEYQVTGEELEQIKRRLIQGESGFIELKEGGFKLSHIVSWSLESRQIENQLTAPEKYPQQTPEERLKARKKIEEIRNKLTQGL